MALTTGRDGALTVDGNTITQVRRWTLNRERARVDATVMGQTDRSSLPGFGDGSGTIVVGWDEVDTNGQQALLAAAAAGTVVALVLYPKGNTTGLPRITIASAVILGSTEEGTVDDALLERTFNFAKSSGAIVEDLVP